MRSKILLIVAALALAAAPAAAQKTEIADGVRLVHNAGPGAWGKTPRVTIEPVLTLGDPETADPNVAFFMPTALAVDAAGSIHILDMGNHRVQKFGRDGKYLATYGRQGQGPGEFLYPSGIAIDAKGFLYVSDPNNQRIQVLTPDGKDHKTIKGLEQGAGPVLLGRPGELVAGAPRMQMRILRPGEAEKAAALPKLVKVLDLEGRTVREFGQPTDFKAELLNTAGNETLMTVDAAGQVYLVYPVQNRIDKYAADGRLLWRADRPLPYSMEFKDKGEIERNGQSVSVRGPKLNRCAAGVAVDGRGRIWVATLTRQLKKEEQVGRGVTMSMDEKGGRTIGYKVVGEGQELRTTDAYKLEVFDADGALLGSLPLDSFVDGIFIAGDRLFLLDEYRGAQVREYRIKG
ncbi:MAG TPA: NHL repeat-containing protein [Candidatus Aminicenantes bacterium]|nr:NHL repeat-containing protein [Candidatus Aminicenantes bacterium]HRY66139.1 NHL repeat-containing protein [Candidatus Aminicenantes bacterium]HRZ73053.1 NHL repeat-containing protein [Candidatus Aminicenantes bacterium]